MNLDARLSLAFSLYDPCALAADIGTDHAHLPIALLRAGKCLRMILTDISPDALRNARENVGLAGLTDRVAFRLGGGLEVLGDVPGAESRGNGSCGTGSSASEPCGTERLGNEPCVPEPCGMVSVLGMGGRTIREILLRGADRLRGARLLLSAHTDLPLVRCALSEIGYTPAAEIPCLDAGRYYLILKAVPGEGRLSPREIRLGSPALFSCGSPMLPAYLGHRAEVLEAKRAAEPDEEQIAELEDDIAFLRSRIPG